MSLVNIRNMINTKIIIVTVVLLILALPYLTNSPWTIFDYIIGATLLSIAGLALEITFNKIKSKKNMIIVGLIILVTFIYVWAELAVGIFTTLGS
jgi:hypothetical protein